MKHPTRHGFKRSALAAAICLALGATAQAQLATATIKGQVSAGTTAASAGLVVMAVNQANGNRYRTMTRADGSYVLAGLPPGSYEIEVNGQRSQALTVAVGETAAVDLAAGAAAAAGSGSTAQRVVITGALNRKEVRNSEVGTSVSQKAIELMPQNTRNFLSFAELAPGVRVDVDANGFTTFRAGGMDRNNVNVYIDGVSQKNNILRGGMTGLDSARGNPFPQVAVAEYKVIGQNYKAEYDQVSSAAITAVTKSGTNELRGEVFLDYTKDSFVAYNPIQEENRRNGNDRSKFAQKQYGFALGGPIKQDTAHFFVAYEGKNIATPRNVGLADVASILPNAGLAASFYGLQGSHNQELKEHLLLTRIDLELGADSHLEASLRLRRDDDFLAENDSRSAPGNDKNRTNDEDRFDLRHTLTRSTFVNEARFGYEKYRWNPRSALNENEIKYYVSPVNLPDNSKREVIWTGGSPDNQDRGQKGVLLQNDLTFTGMPGHTMKGGAKFKAMEYDLSGTSRSVDILHKLIDNTSGNPIVGLFAANPAADYFQIDPKLAPVQVNYKNNQFGLYFQDDWKLSKQLELNLGLRWDYESNMLNNGYHTPADRVAALNALDTTRYGITPAPGQTYAQSLANGGININDYIATGNRKPYMGALAPRLGFSFDVAGDASTVVYGGFGRAYDRTMANNALDELQRNSTPGSGEVWLIRNNYKMPFSDQFSVGLRQALGGWNAEVGLNYMHAKNQFNWFAGDRDPNGGFGNRAESIDPNWGAGPPGLGMLILGDFVTQQKTTQMFVRADKPYTRSSGWAAGVTYTHTSARTTHRDWNDDLFNWGYGKPGDAGGYHTNRNAEKHRLVATAFTDQLLPWGMALSGKVTVGSGLPYRITSCPTSWDACKSFEGDASWTRQVDIAVSKGIKVPGGELSVRLDMLNLFNTVNWTGYNDWGGGPGNPQNWTGGDNPDLGKRTAIGSPMRTYKLGLRYVF